jgi:hypothetical protein
MCSTTSKLEIMNLTILFFDFFFNSTALYTKTSAIKDIFICNINVDYSSKPKQFILYSISLHFSGLNINKSIFKLK